MIQLAIFCPECSLWLILMLLGAWLLGWLFWSMIKGSQYQATINDLRPQLADLKHKNADLHTELTQEKYNLEKRNGEYDKLRSRHMDLDLKYKVQSEELTQALNENKQLKSAMDPPIS